MGIANDMRRKRARDEAVRLLCYYIRPGFEAAGKWDADNDAEIGAAIDELLEAAEQEDAT